MTPPVDDRGLNGYVVLVLDERFRAPGTEDLRELARRGALDGLAGFLDALGNPPALPLIRGAGRDLRARLEERSRDRLPAGAPPSLLLFWRVDVRATGRNPDMLTRWFGALPGVQLAYSELQVRDACAGGDRAAAARRASHLDPHGVGVGLDGVAGFRGGDGAGVGCVDVEQGWRLTHPALAGVAPRLLAALPLGNRDGVGTYLGGHGTSVLGVLAGTDAANGVRPMVPACTDLTASSHYDATAGTDMHVAAAIDVAAAWLTGVGTRRGGVLLVEAQRGPVGQELPSEVDLADRRATLDAIGLGVTVVAAAGNGHKDLDAWSHPLTGLRLDRASDSGAIMVGAGKAARLPGGHERWDDSNWGSRVDCYAWGESVRTADVTGTCDFDGTSAAAAIVAGVAVLAQAMRLAATGAQLEPPALRAILGAAANGTPQVGTRLIGVMPDLSRVATAVGALPR